jgi:hypothetical protein
MRKKIYYEMAAPKLGTGVIVPYLEGSRLVSRVRGRHAIQA